MRAFSASHAGLFWVLASELFSMAAKPAAAAAATAVLFAVGAAANLAFLPLLAALGPASFLLYAAVMAICLFSLAGIPPMVGFYAKLSVLQALIASGQSLHLGLAIFAVMMSLVGAFYYLRVVKVMYFDPPITATTVSAPLDVRAVLSVNGALVLVLGLVPGGLMALCARAIVQMLGT